MPMSSKNCAHWSALMTGSKDSRIDVENADRDLLWQCASLRLAEILLANSMRAFVQIVGLPIAGNGMFNTK